MLSNCRVFIVEDEPFVAVDLARSVEDAHGEVLGPFATVKDGLAYLAQNHVQAAILDIHLADRDITPIALGLLGGGAAVVFHSASDIPVEVTALHGEQALCRKPMLSEQVITRLVRAIRSDQGGGL